MQATSALYGNGISQSSSLPVADWKILAEKKKSARDLLRIVGEAIPRLEREAAQEAIAAGEPWPPDPPKESGEW